MTGTAPLPASSGNTTRHRLNRGGNRKLNHALHLIAINRCRLDTETKAYVARRLAEGKTKREVLRCLKRHLGGDLPSAHGRHTHRNSGLTLIEGLEPIGLPRAWLRK
jgi:hypothetical protein